MLIMSRKTACLEVFVGLLLLVGSITVSMQDVAFSLGEYVLSALAGIGGAIVMATGVMSYLDVRQHERTVAFEASAPSPHI